MLAPVSDAIQRFRRRLQLATFMRAMAGGCFVAMVVVAGVLVAERFASEQFVAELPGWSLWSAIGAVSLLSGVVVVRRTEFGDETIVQHLEQRLATGGLLLTASQGVGLDPSYERQLVQRLQGSDEVLPAIRWRHLLVRPLAVALLVVLAQQLPEEITQQQRNEALEVAVDRLAKEVEEIAQLEAVPDEQVEELRNAVEDLQERAKAGDDGLWREVDQLQERIDREEKLAAGDEGAANSGGADSRGSSSQSGEAVAGGGKKPIDPAALADAMTKLGDLDAQGKLDGALLDKVMQALPEGLDEAKKQAIDSALQKDGAVAPEDLPADPESQAALAEAIAAATEQLGGDAGSLDEMMGEASQAELEAMAEELASLAEQFEPAESSGGEGSGGEQQEVSAEQLTAELSEDLAKAAAELSEAGALDQLPEGLREAMVEAGLSALENVDLQKLMSLLPEDLSQLTVMAEQLADVAENLAGEQGGQEGGGGLPQPSEAMKKKMAELAKGLMEKVGRQPGQLAGQGDGQSNGGQNKGGQNKGGQNNAGRPAPGMSGMAGTAGEQTGSGTEGGGHAALRLTEDTQGGLGTVDVELPGRDPDDLPKEWAPKTVDKGKPEVGRATAPGTGRAGATGRGSATWQLRLMPRHRDVVRRFFAERDKKNK